MKQALRITYLYLLIIAVSGVYLRALPFLPAPILSFENLRHAHSHLGFLGWVYSALFLGFVHFFTSEGTFSKTRYNHLFWWTQLVAVAMFVSFAFTGYGAFSIVLLTIHTVLAFLFIRIIYKDWALPKNSASSRFAFTAFVCFILSALGPLAIPVIQFGSGGSVVWMKTAIHFYLYFQYGGWFLFGLIAILIRVLQMGKSPIPEKGLIQSWGFLTAGLLPVFFVGLSFTKSSMFLMWAAFSGVLLQAIGIWKLLFLVTPKFNKKALSGLLISFFFIALIIKNAGELLASFPPSSVIFNLNNHFLVLSYLHFILLGLVTLFLFWMFLEMGYGKRWNGFKWTGLGLFVFGFAVTELYLFAMGLNSPLPNHNEALLIVSSIMALGLLLLLIPFLSNDEWRNKRVS